MVGGIFPSFPLTPIPNPVSSALPQDSRPSWAGRYTLQVMTEEKNETIDDISFPDVPPTFQRVEKVDERREDVKNDVEIFWEITKIPNSEIPADVVDGNHPDNYEITTHDHVDQTVGHISPTKRVKKILPPFGGIKLRKARRVESSFSKKLKNAKEEVTKPPLESISSHHDTTQTTELPKLSSKMEDENLTAGFLDVPTHPSSEDEIQGIRLVPNEFGLLTPNDEKVREDGEEGEEEEESTMQKSIWDLLKEREQFNADSAHLDVVESSGNGTEVTTRFSAEKTKSLYEHFDSDSAEVEFETENFNGGSNIEKHELPISWVMPWLQVKDKQTETREKLEVKTGKENNPQDVSNLFKLTQSEKSMSGVSVSIIDSVNGDSFKYDHRSSKWYLLLLTGNSTIVKLRRKDFTKYLKLNLAARLSVEYDDVKVNKVILAPPKVLVNISVFAPSDDVAEESQLDFKIIDKGEAPLYKLAETNATLLELSGEEYHVIQFLSFESQKPEAEAHKDISNTLSMTSRQNDVEFILYTFLGSACACAALLIFFVTLTRYYKNAPDFSWLKSKQAPRKSHENSEYDQDDFNGISPAVIYSGGFPQIRGSWMTGVGQKAMAPLRQQFSNVELRDSLPHRKVPVYPDFEDRPCASPRHSKLQIYNCDADSLVIPMPVQSKILGKGKMAKTDGSDTHPLDVRILGEKTGQDNPIFTN